MTYEEEEISNHLQQILQQILSDDRYRDNPLLDELRLLADKYFKLSRKLDKIAKISDQFQSQIRKLNEIFQQAALTDSLTNLPNRRYIRVRSMTTTPLLKYFAYGSNMYPLRLQKRVPSSRALGLATLTGHTLRFHKRGQDGSAKCNVLHTGKVSDRVIGVVYEIASRDKKHLDLAEGLGKGYGTETLPFVLQGVAHTAFLYRADPDYIDDTLRPFSWYRELVLRGARLYRIPPTYIERIRQVECIDDPDVARAAAYWRLLTD